MRKVTQNERFIRAPQSECSDRLGMFCGYLDVADQGDYNRTRSQRAVRKHREYISDIRISN